MEGKKAKNEGSRKSENYSRMKRVIIKASKEGSVSCSKNLMFEGRVKRVERGIEKDGKLLEKEMKEGRQERHKNIG